MVCLHGRQVETVAALCALAGLFLVDPLPHRVGERSSHAAATLTAFPQVSKLVVFGSDGVWALLPGRRRLPWPGRMTVMAVRWFV